MVLWGYADKCFTLNYSLVTKVSGNETKVNMEVVVVQTSVNGKVRIFVIKSHPKGDMQS